MSEVTAEATEPAERGAQDEARIARGVAVGLPIVTIVAGLGVGVVMGPATAILVFAAGLLLGVIAILWGSLRILSGDAPLPPDLEELDMHAQAGGPLGARKKMLLRALKDLDNERAIGKLDVDDYEPIAAQYRNELKTVLTKIDESLAPTRALAEEAALEHMKKVGFGASPREVPVTDEEKPAKPALVEDRLVCPKCEAKNEKDAKFCKECATKLVPSENADA